MEIKDTYEVVEILQENKDNCAEFGMNGNNHDALDAMIEAVERGYSIGDCYGEFRFAENNVLEAATDIAEFMESDEYTMADLPDFLFPVL